MGGGAGIKIEVELDQFYVVRSRNNKRKFKVLQQPVIVRWSADGYEDGERNLRGNMLKATVTIDNIDPGDVDYLTKAWGFHPGNRLAAWVDTEAPNRTIWRGYVRGKWQDVFPLDMDFEIHVEMFGHINATLTIDPVDREEFDRFWNDVFNFIAEAEDPGEPDAMSSEQVESYHWELVEQDYCVA